MNSDSRWTPTDYPRLAAIVFLAFALRVIVRLYLGAADFWASGYGFFLPLAHSIASGNGMALAEGSPTAFRVPLYPAFLAAATFGQNGFLPIVLAQSLVGAAIVWCAALIARDMFGSPAGLVAASLAAIYPYYVVHDTALQENSLYTLFTVAAVLLLMRARRGGSAATAGCAGLVFGAAVLTRANLAPFAAVAPLWLLVPAAAKPWLGRRELWASVVCAAAIALVVAPWIVRSYRLTGVPTLTTQSGFFLWLGNNPETFSRYPTQSIDLSQRVALAALGPQDKAELKSRRGNEAATDRWFRDKALAYMRDHPWQTIGSGFRKLAAGFCLLPSPRRGFWPDLIYLLSYGPVMILGLAGMWASRQNWREHLIFYALFASFAAVSAVYFAHTSYRSYLDVYWMIFAAPLLVRFARLARGAPS